MPFLQRQPRQTARLLLAVPEPMKAGLRQQFADAVRYPDGLLSLPRVPHDRQLGRPGQQDPLGRTDLATKLGNPLLDHGGDARPTGRGAFPASWIAALTGLPAALAGRIARQMPPILPRFLLGNLHVFRPPRYDTKCDT